MNIIYEYNLWIYGWLKKDILKVILCIQRYSEVIFSKKVEKTLERISFKNHE